MVRKKNLLILGGFGFIGSNVIDALLDEDDFNIIVFTHTESISKFAEHVKVFYGDFNNQNDLIEVFKANKIDVVLHLISTTVPATSNESMEYDINSNLIGTIRLLDIMVKYNALKIVFLSSGGTVYGEITESTVSENHPTHPISSHGIVKLAIEKYLYLYQRIHNLNYLILRASNPYGLYHQSENQGFINVAIKKALRNEKVIIWGDGSVVRDFIYAKDLATIIAHLLRLELYNQIINIGSGVGYSINQVLGIVAENHPGFEYEYKPYRIYDVQKIVLDIRKLQSFGSFCLTDIRQGIAETYEWYKSSQ